MLNLKIRVEAYIAYSDCNDGPSHALIELNTKIINRIINLNKHVKILRVNNIDEYDYSPEWISEVDEKDNSWENGSIDGLKLSVENEGFNWVGYIKHSDPAIEVYTSRIPIGMLHEYIKIKHTHPEMLPLLLNKLKYKENKPVLENRIKKG